MKRKLLPAVVLTLLFAVPALAGDFYIVRIDTADVHERAQVSDAGIDITYVDLEEGWIWALVHDWQMLEVRNLGFKTELLDAKVMPSGYEAYHDYAEVVAELQLLAEQYPDLTSLFTIGQSLEGRDLWCLKISDNPDLDETDEPGHFLVAMHHAREILTPEVALFTARQLLENYGADERTTFVVDEREIFIVPNLNPDGSEFDQLGSWFSFWRKNRRVNDGSACRGVDLNRNYGYLWGGPGSSGNPCSETYRGAEAFSEPETAAVRDFIYAHSNITTLISLHTYARLVLYPWGNTYQHIEDQIDYLTHKYLAEAMAEFNHYQPGQASSLYPTTGDTTDWGYGELGIISFTFEMEPSQLNPLGFYPQPSVIPTACENNYKAIFLTIGLSRDPSLVLASDLWKLEAELAGDAVQLTWASIIETEAAGWNVLRSEGGKDFAPINGELIAAGQAEYNFVDENIEEGATYQYLIEFVSNYDNNQQFGPLTVDVPGQGDDDLGDDDLTDDDQDDDLGDDDLGDDDLDDDDASADEDTSTSLSTGDDDAGSDGCGC